MTTEEISEIEGISASPGLRLGRIWKPLQSPTRLGIADIEPDRARDALRTAIAVVGKELRSIAKTSDPMAAHIMGCQIALLEDPVLSAPAFEAIRRGESLPDAWMGAMAEQISRYQADEDDAFRATAIDFIDLRDRVLDALNGCRKLADTPSDAILLCDELTPSRFLELSSSVVAVVLVKGNVKGHVAMLARARGVPLVVGANIEVADISEGTVAVVDAANGRIVLRPNEELRRQALAVARSSDSRVQMDTYRRPLIAQDGSRIKLYINVDNWSTFEQSKLLGEGVGLARTEFLLQQGEFLLDEERQYLEYVRLIRWAEGKPVTIRTLDAGADKLIPGLTVAGEANSCLGVRGVRLSLARPEIFGIQVRALVRAAVHGTLRVSIPMVTVPEEMIAVRSAFEEAVANFKAQGVSVSMPAIGMMVETPAAALTVDAFRADFLSIGTNDLTQYTMAASRDCTGVSHLLDATAAAPTKLVRMVTDFGRRARIEVCACGEAATESAGLEALVAAGVCVFSVPQTMLPKVGDILAGLLP